LTIYYMNAPLALIIHGGSGRLYKDILPAEKEEAYTNTLKAAVQAGYTILEEGGSSLAAVEASIRILEDSPLFNAGKGAVYNSNSIIELDAAIMDGNSMKAGSVTGVSTVRNPISAARAVLEKSDHVMLSGAGADEFATTTGLDIVDPTYFRVEERWEQIQKIKREEISAEAGNQHKYGTVGAVALDAAGHLAAGTSTGGMLNKKWGRIGDTPVIGAGTYANGVGAISCTGYGEYFIRYTAARDIAALMEYKNLSAEEAAREVVFNKISKAGGAGGVIVLDAKGNPAIAHSTEGMFWAIMSPGKPLQVNACHMIIE
jgi:L-asparaginase / beta-aspartyl-peptidase